MPIKAQPSVTAKAPSTSTDQRDLMITEQSITASLTVEIVHDLETGEPTQVAYTEGNAGDLQVVTTSQVLAMAAQQHAQINRQVALALEFEAVTAKTPADRPATWTVADSKTGMPLKVTCMSGCHGFHLEASSGTAEAEDLCCAQYDKANTVELPIGCGADTTAEWSTLSVEIKSMPFHPDEGKRVPTAAVEVTDDHYIEDLDPDGLAAVIDKLEQRAAAMRVRHAEFVRIRDDYLGRQA
ncbi:DUF6907 domain-containing protein [Streptomyces sp. NPDC003343]